MGSRQVAPGPGFTLVERACAAARMKSGAFASDVLAVDGRTYRSWKYDRHGVKKSTLIVCQAIIDRPALAAELMAAHRKLPRY